MLEGIAAHGDYLDPEIVCVEEHKNENKEADTDGPILN